MIAMSGTVIVFLLHPMASVWRTPPGNRTITWTILVSCLALCSLACIYLLFRGRRAIRALMIILILLQVILFVQFSSYGPPVR